MPIRSGYDLDAGAPSGELDLSGLSIVSGLLATYDFAAGIERIGSPPPPEDITITAAGIEAGLSPTDGVAGSLSVPRQLQLRLLGFRVDVYSSDGDIRYDYHVYIAGSSSFHLSVGTTSDDTIAVNYTEHPDRISLLKSIDADPTFRACQARVYGIGIFEVTS